MTDTHCPYCALQCAQKLGGDPIAAEPRAFPTNVGGMCQKGWTSAELLRAQDRITAPLRRVPSTGSRGEDRFEPVGWDEALDDIAARVQAIQAADGPDGIAVFGGGGLTNEKAYQLGKFARLALRTRMIDYNGRFCMSSAAAAANRTLGVDRGLPFPLTDLNDAHVVMLFGSNLADTMPPAVQHLGGVRERGGLIVVDPRLSATAKLTEDGAGEHVQLVPGTDLVLILGLLHIVFAESLTDDDYLATRVDGVDAVRRSVAEWWPERVAATTGVAETQLRRIARSLADASPHRGGGGAFLLTGRGSEQHVDGADTVTAVINLALSLGLVGAERGGYGAITGQGNGQGGREHGQKSDQLPGYRMIADPAAREHVAAVWGVDPEIIPGPGVPAVELLMSLGMPDGPRALFVHGSNVLVSAPDADAVRRRIESLDLVVVCDFIPSETAMLADYILPVTQWAEEEGTMTGLEGRVLRRRKAVEAPEGVRSELEIFSALADRLDAPGTWATEPREVYDELRRASAGGRADYAGISYDRLDAGEALYWPCPVRGPPRHAAPVRRVVPDTERSRHDDRRTPGRSRRRVAGRGSGLARHRTGAAALPVRRPDQAGVEAQRLDAPGIHRDPPDARRTHRHRGHRRHPDHVQAGLDGRSGAHQPRHPAGHGVRAVPFRGRGHGQRRHQLRDGSGVRHAGVQGVRSPDQKGRGMNERQRANQRDFIPRRPRPASSTEVAK